MIILLFFAFISGVITIAAPCIWPLLPIILSSTTAGGHKKPLGITLGIMASFTIFTLTISYIVKIIPFDPNALRLFAVVVIGFLGIALIVPKLNHILEGYVSRLSGGVGGKIQSQKGDGFASGLITGLSLGIVWAPCAGPILATIATLAATRQVSFEIVIVTLFYVAGVGVPLFIFATLGTAFFSKSRFISKYTGRIQQIFGVLMILTAISIATNYDKVLQARLLDLFPSYANFVVNFESADVVKKELNKLKKAPNSNDGDMQKKPFNMFDSSNTNIAALPVLGVAPEFVGIDTWLNSGPLTLKSLKGKVVLIDFWTYTCINCIRTMPYVTAWYEKYKNEGLVIVGIHTPEFEFERKTENVIEAMRRYGITYPVAQDNDYRTWLAYDNHYWPAKYLVDKDGNVRYIHFGEGNYEETERAIQQLLQEAGSDVSTDTLDIKEATVRGVQTPETYMGSERLDRLVSPEKITGQKQQFTNPQSIPEHSFAFEGEWIVQKQDAVAGKNAAVEFNFYAEKVFLVITPKKEGEKMKVSLDGKPIGMEVSGPDVVNSTVVLDKPRLYELVDTKGKKGNHLLRLEFDTQGTAIFAFTFG